jgi:hypothetical protein
LIIFALSLQKPVICLNLSGNFFSLAVAYSYQLIIRFIPGPPAWEAAQKRDNRGAAAE